MVKELNTRDRSNKISAYAKRHIKVSPYTEEMEQLIATAIENHRVKTRQDAVTFLELTGLSDGIETGGEVLNKRQLVADLEKRFGCVYKTALKHVERARLSTLHEDYKPPAWGGDRRSEEALSVGGGL